MRRFGLIGNPVDHSFSPGYFNRKFREERLDARYDAFRLDSVEELPALLGEYPDLEGINVTSPFKHDVIALLDSMSPEAERLGAVNVIRITDGSLTGFNSDVDGFRRSVIDLLPPGGTGALVCGSGGASLAVAEAFRSLGIETVRVSRTAAPGRITYAEITPEIIDVCRVIVNATPLGMGGHADEAPALPYDLITPHHVCHDLIYNPCLTPFMRYALRQGAAVKNGLDMLIGQAERSWEIWNEEIKSGSG